MVLELALGVAPLPTTCHGGVIGDRAPKWPPGMSHPPLTYWMLESRPWVMTPVNLVVLLVSTSIHWV